MTKITKTLAKGTLGTVAAGAMALATATPAMADDRRHKDGISAGDVIAGALIIGGIAAAAGAFDGDRDRKYRDRRYRDRDYRGYNNRGYNYNHRYNRGYATGRNAVERCVRAAERQAKRFGGYRFADVTQIRDVDRTRDGFKVKGRIVVDGARGYGYRNQNYDRGRFTCYVGRGQRPFVDFSGIRGLR